VIRYFIDDDASQGVPGLAAPRPKSAQETVESGGTHLEQFPVDVADHLHVTRTRVVLDPAAVRQCEALQAKLWLSYPEGRARKVTLFLGASAGCGVSTVVASFVGALAQNPGAQILLIEFGGRGARHHLGAQGSDLGHLLEDNPILSEAPQAGPRNVYLVSRANLGAIAPSVLQSQAFDEFLARARERFEHVVIDAPPLQHHPESLMLCRKADGVVLVVQAGRTRKQTALWAKRQIENARGNLTGVVLNRRRYYIPRWLYKLL
jgi:Mrp family chromosome partitioning ATPase